MLLMRFSRGRVIQLNAMGKVVYFVQAGADGPIKIGTTQKLGSRLRKLQAENAYAIFLLGIEPSDKEHELHERFMAYHFHHEWFHPANPILEYIERIHLAHPSLQEYNWSEKDWGDVGESSSLDTDYTPLQAENFRIIKSRVWLGDELVHSQSY